MIIINYTDWAAINGVVKKHANFGLGYMQQSYSKISDGSEPGNSKILLFTCVSSTLLSASVISVYHSLEVHGLNSYCSTEVAQVL